MDGKSAEVLSVPELKRAPRGLLEPSSCPDDKVRNCAAGVRSPVQNIPRSSRLAIRLDGETPSVIIYVLLVFKVGVLHFKEKFDRGCRQCLPLGCPGLAADGWIMFVGDALLGLSPVNWLHCGRRDPSNVVPDDVAVYGHQPESCWSVINHSRLSTLSL
jgi:hypothetical protein